MTRIVIKHLVWDNWNNEHIKRHTVTKEEVLKAGKNQIFHKHSYSNRYAVTGRSGKRLITLIVRCLKQNTYYVVTTRDSSKKERKVVYEKEEIKNTNV